MSEYNQEPSWISWSNCPALQPADPSMSSKGIDSVMSRSNSFKEGERESGLFSRSKIECPVSIVLSPSYKAMQEVIPTGPPNNVGFGVRGEKERAVCDKIALISISNALFKITPIAPSSSYEQRSRTDDLKKGSSRIGLAISIVVLSLAPLWCP